MLLMFSVPLMLKMPGPPLPAAIFPEVAVTELPLAKLIVPVPPRMAPSTFTI
jgi:hypothetical protein